MKITSGQYKGLSLSLPEHIRPITQKDKKMLIDTLRYDLTGAKILDLYAGSGQIGIEALSNGAAHATFVESERKNIDIIRNNLLKIKFDPVTYTIVNQDISSFIRQNSAKYDIIIADPPHFTVNWADFSLIDQLSLPGTILVIKHDSHNPPPDISGFKLIKTKGAKDNLIKFYLAQTNS